MIFLWTITYIMSYVTHLYNMMSDEAITAAIGVSLPMALFAFWFSGALVAALIAPPGGNLGGISAVFAQHSKKQEYKYEVKKEKVGSNRSRGRDNV